MTTVISVYNSEGCVGRCDARCHDAKHADCTCICGGANHGVGGYQAQVNAWEHATEWIENYVETNGPDTWYAKVPEREAVQMPLL